MERQVIYPDAIWTAYEEWPTAAFRDPENRKGVAHTTQGGPSSLNDFNQASGGVLNWYPQSGGIPHFTVLATGAVHQHYRLDHYSRALRNRRGGVETNTDGAIQIELEGHAGHEHTTELLVALAALLRWLTATGWVLPAFPLGRMTKPYRKATNQQWDDGRGWFGHGQIPEQDHTDPDMTDRTWAVFAGAVLGHELPDLDQAAIDLPDVPVGQQVKDLQADLWAAALARPELGLIDLGKYPMRALWVDGIYGDDTRRAERLLAAAPPAQAPDPVVPVAVSVDADLVESLALAGRFIASGRGDLERAESILAKARGTLAPG